MNYWMLAGGWAIYFLLHSVFAAEGVKRRLMSPVGRYYRIIYSVISTVVGSSRVDLQACKLEYSIVSPK